MLILSGNIFDLWEYVGWVNDPSLETQDGVAASDPDELLSKAKEFKLDHLINNKVIKLQLLEDLAKTAALYSNVYHWNKQQILAINAPELKGVHIFKKYYGNQNDSIQIQDIIKKPTP